MSSTKRTRAMKKVGATAVIAGGLFAGSFAVAGAVTNSNASPSTSGGSSQSSTTPPSGPAAPRGPMRPLPGPGGTVTGFSATSLTLETPGGTTSTFTLNGSTTYTKDAKTASFSDLAVGEEVSVRPTTRPTSPSSTTPLVAAAVHIHSPHLGGIVKSVSGSSGSLTIVVADRQGFWHTIVTSASTTFTDNGSAVTNPTISTGEVLGALGTIAPDHTTLDATQVMIGRPPAPPKPPAASGSAGSGSSSSSGSGTPPLGPRPFGRPGSASSSAPTTGA